MGKNPEHARASLVKATEQKLVCGLIKLTAKPGMRGHGIKLGAHA